MREEKNRLVSSLYPDCHTAHELVQRAFKKYSGRRAFGTRTFLGRHPHPTEDRSLKMFGETNWIMYWELAALVEQFGEGLKALGLSPAPPLAELSESCGPHVILIYEETCAHWMAAALGAFSQSIVVATTYATLGVAALMEALVQTEARVMLCNIADVERVAYACQRCPDIKLTTIVYSTRESGSRFAQAPKGSSLRVISVDDVLGFGGSVQGRDSGGSTPPVPDALAVIMYTSGSSGKPKGVLITHSCIAASAGGIGRKFMQFGMRCGREFYLSYLPAAHILELVAQITAISLGCAVGFANPQTLSSRGACRRRPDGSINYEAKYPYPPGALQEYRPTAIVATPKIWDVLKKAVEAEVGGRSRLRQWLFQVAYSGRRSAVFSSQREAPLFRALVFRRLRLLLGGRLKVGIAGGGPLSPLVQTFIRTAFCIPLVQGYALTETTCAGSVQLEGDLRCGVVGAPLGSVEIRLRSCINKQGEPQKSDARGRPYLWTDRTHDDGTSCIGRGEVLIRGPSVSLGYFRDTERTAKAYDSEGWFHTGDVGLMLPDGSLKIVDRLKNLVKLSGGEYVAIEAMEREYSNSPFISALNGGILCYADGEMDRPVAVAQVDILELRKWARSSGIPFASDEGLCCMPVAVREVLRSLMSAHRRGGLAETEKLAAVALISGTGLSEGRPSCESPWTIFNGGLTASGKLCRAVVQRGVYAPIFSALRAEGMRCTFGIASAAVGAVAKSGGLATETP